MERILLASGLGLVLWNRVLMAVGLRRPKDGWRRGASIALRGEESTFVLSSFGLRSNQMEICDRVQRLLDRETDYHLRIEPGEFEDRPVRHTSPCFTFAFENWRDGLERFVRPDSWSGTCHGLDPEAGKCLLNFVARTSYEGISDLWMRVNHVGLDGVPAQELLTKLEQELGRISVTYPNHEQFLCAAGPRSVDGRESAIEVQTFVDLTPLLAWRRRQNALLGESMTLTAAVLWWLASQEPFRRLRMGTTVDLAADGTFGRGVGVVVIRPFDFFDKVDGLAKYVGSFNQQLERTRQRTSDAIKTLNAAAAIPARLERLVLRSALKSDRAFGGVGVTMIRDACVFGAPISEVGHDHGFIAIGSAALPTESGQPVTCISVKGVRGMIEDYPTILHRALHEGPL